MEERMLRRLLSFPYQLCLIVLFILLGVSWGIGCYFASLFPNGEDRARRYLIHWARISLRLARLEITVAGLERLDLNRPYVFMPNHSSFLDVLLVFAFIPHNFRSIAKEEFFSIPLLGSDGQELRTDSARSEEPKEGLAEHQAGRRSCLREGCRLSFFRKARGAPTEKFTSSRTRFLCCRFGHEPQLCRS